MARPQDTIKLLAAQKLFPDFAIAPVKVGGDTVGYTATHEFTGDLESKYLTALCVDIVKMLLIQLSNLKEADIGMAAAPVGPIRFEVAEQYPTTNRQVRGLWLNAKGEVCQSSSVTLVDNDNPTPGDTDDYYWYDKDDNIYTLETGPTHWEEDI